MTVPDYSPADGVGAWEILTEVDSIMAGLDPLPWQRNGSANDQWSRVLGLLDQQQAKPDDHLRYNLAVQTMTPTGPVETQNAIEFETTIQVAWLFLAYPQQQWESHLLAIQSAQAVRRAMMAPNRFCFTGGAVRLVDVQDAFQPAANDGKAGLLITQTYRFRHLESVT